MPPESLRRYPRDGYSLLGPHRRKILLLERIVGSNRPTTDPSRHPWLQLKTATGWALWRDTATGREHLYDRRSDPRETHNLMRRRPKLARRLEARMDADRRLRAPCP